MKKNTMLLTTRNPVKLQNMKWQYETSAFEVEVLAVVKIYAMVRRKGFMPFVVYVKNLTEVIK